MVSDRMNQDRTDPFLENYNIHHLVIWPNLLAPKLSTMSDGEKVTKLKTMVCDLKMRVEKNPEDFPNFFRIYEKLLDMSQPSLDKELRKRLLIQDVAGFVYLADYDDTGFLTYELMRGSPRLSGPPFNYPNVYENPRLYGPAMNAFSNHLTGSGIVLKSFIFDRISFC